MREAPEVRPELVALGQALAFDKILSGNRDVSCMTCHHPVLGSDDDLSLSIGVGGSGLGEARTHPDGAFIPRSAPPLFNLHAMSTMFWDGRVHARDGRIETPAGEAITDQMRATFEFGAVSAQAMFPVTSREEMRGEVGSSEVGDLADDDLSGQWRALMARLGDIPQYVQMFETAYPATDFDDMTFAHAANAIAGFEIAGFEAGQSPWDALLRGDDSALAADELRGAASFLGQADCWRCHRGDALSDLRFHNTGLAQFGPGQGHGDGRDDWGRAGITGQAPDTYAFRTPPLRNVAVTGPWGHAGQFTELEAFVQHYVNPAQSLRQYSAAEQGVDPALAATQLDTTDAIVDRLSPLVRQANVGGGQVDDLVAFLHALTDPASLETETLVPASVPSGLPLTD